MSLAVVPAPQAQFFSESFETSPPGKPEVELFEVCRSCDSTCCVGCVAPWCLVGATAKNKFGQKIHGPCEGCSGFCLGSAALANFASPLATILFQWLCIRRMVRNYDADYDDENCFNICMGYFFCYPCAVCQDYKTSTLEVKVH